MTAELPIARTYKITFSLPQLVIPELARDR
jgi:hypothetical protein